MSEQTNSRPDLAAHPTTQQFVDQLAAWRFKLRKDLGPHMLFRGPAGGTLRVLRSHLHSRLDPALANKAAAMVHVTVDQFWAGPPRGDEQPAPHVDQVGVSARPAGGVGKDAAASRKRAGTAARDRNTSIVLSIHASCDRPLGFDQVVDLAGGRLTRAQVRTASSLLFREGDLHRIRSGVYQWAGGHRAVTAAPVATAPSRELRIVPAAPAQPAPLATPTGPGPTVGTVTSTVAARQLFEHFFPAGLRMTAEVYADVERWAELTEKLVAYAAAS